MIDMWDGVTDRFRMVFCDRCDVSDWCEVVTDKCKVVI